MIKPDLPPTEAESVVSHPPAKTEREQDLDFLQCCFKDVLCGDLDWPAETFNQYFAAIERFSGLLGLNGPMSALKLTYGERLAGAAILELSRKISASGKARKIMHQITGRKH